MILNHTYVKYEEACRHSNPTKDGQLERHCLQYELLVPRSQAQLKLPDHLKSWSGQPPRELHLQLGLRRFSIATRDRGSCQVWYSITCSARETLCTTYMYPIQ